MRVVLIVVGVLILGLTPFDSYIADNVPNFLIPLLALPLNSFSIRGLLSLILMFSFHIAVVLLFCSWRMPRRRKHLLIAAITALLSSSAFLAYLASTSGHNSSVTYSGVLVSLILTIPNLVSFAKKRETKLGVWNSLSPMHARFLRWILAFPTALLVASVIQVFTSTITHLYDHYVDLNSQIPDLNPVFMFVSGFTSASLFVYVGFLMAPSYREGIAVVLTILVIFYGGIQIAGLYHLNGKFDRDQWLPISQVIGALLTCLSTFRLVSIPFINKAANDS